MTTASDLQAELTAARARNTELAAQNVRLRNLHRRHILVVNAAVNWHHRPTTARATQLHETVRSYLSR